MKKNLLLISIFAVVSAMAVSCSTDVLDTETVSEPKEQVEEKPSEGDIMVSFLADVEESDDKTSIDESGNVTWNKGDNIRIYWTVSNYSVGTASAAGKSTSFKNVSVSASDYYFATYPAADASVDVAAGKVTCEIPSAQNGSFASVNRMVARTLKGGSSLKFYYMATLVKFNVGSNDITAVTLRSADGSAIAGTVTADFSNVKDAATVPAFTTAGASDEITVQINGAGTYYAAILPGQAIEGGLLFRCQTESEYLPAMSTKANQASTRGKIKNYVIDGGLDSKIPYDYYATASGSGSKNGKSQANAFDAAALQAFIAGNTDNEDISRSQAFRLNGATIHCSGTIALSKPRIEFHNNAYEKQVAFKISGGTLSGSSQNNIIVVGANTNVTFDGVSFKNGFSDTDESASYGGALRITSSSTKVTAASCTFDGNTAVEGGAVYMSAGELNAENCTFKSNSATVAYNYRGGGAVKLGGSNAVANFSGCSFTGNSTAGGGGAICVSSGQAGASKCSFTGNTAAKYGGVLNAESGTIYLNKCRLSSNSAGGWGTVANTAEGSTLAMNACVVYGNSTTGSNDATLVLKSGTTLTNCTLIENVSTNSVIRAEGTASSYLANNIVIAKDAAKLAVYMNSSNHKFTATGGNLIGKLSGVGISAAQAFKKSLSDIYNFKYADFSNPSWTESTGKFSWDNTSFSGYHPIKTDEVKTALLMGGNGFNAWLNAVDADALTKDLNGNSRTVGGVRPGSWEGSKMSKSDKRLSIQRMLAYYQWGGQSSGVLVMSHRCHINSSGQTENSVEAGKQALNAGADILEIDPRRTQDGNIVVFHDHCIENMINSITQTNYIEDLTVSKIQSYDLVERKDFGSSMRWRRSTGIKIPTLEQFLAGVAAARSYYLCLDMEKVISENSSNYLTYMKQIADIVNAAGMMDHTLFYVHKAGADSGQDKASTIRDAFASWGYPDACIYTYPYGNSPASDCNYEWCLNYPQYVYAAQASYSPDKASQHNLKYIAEDGMVGTVNMLNTLYSSIPEYSLNENQLTQLLAGFPYCNIISTDVPAELVASLTVRGLRPSRYEDKLTTSNGFENYQDNKYNW